MRTFIAFVVLLAVSALASTVYPNHDPKLIVPGGRIGEADLGMSRPAIDEINRASPCPVLPTYDASGRATRLETNWGGGCLISDKIQVGLPFGPALRAFGKPDRAVEAARYPHATAVWIVYEGQGIAFRVLGWPSGTTIQTIAVFPALVAQGSGRSRTDVLIPERVIQPAAVR